MFLFFFLFGGGCDLAVSFSVALEESYTFDGTVLRSRAGRTNAPDSPEPIGAHPIKSRRSNRVGIDCIWMGVGSFHLFHIDSMVRQGNDKLLFHHAGHGKSSKAGIGSGIGSGMSVSCLTV